MGRVTYTITTFNSRIRATILVDGYPVEKAFFTNFEKARVWCEAQKEHLREVVKED